MLPSQNTNTLNHVLKEPCQILTLLRILRMFPLTFRNVKLYTTVFWNHWLKLASIEWMHWLLKKTILSMILRTDVTSSKKNPLWLTASKTKVVSFNRHREREISGKQLTAPFWTHVFNWLETERLHRINNGI